MFIGILLGTIAILISGLTLWCICILRKNRERKLMVAFRIVNSNILHRRDMKRQGIVIGQLGKKGTIKEADIR
jgi:hypothetical protein